MKKLIVYLAALWVAIGCSAQIDGDPLYCNTTSTNGIDFFAVRPFYSSSVEPERWRKDYLWPLFTQKGFKEERYGRFLFFGYSTDFKEDTERHRVWVLPFYFKGTSAKDEDYFALFPLGGTIHEFLGRDSVSFALFPLRVTSDINEVHTSTWLWPLISKTTGDRVDRFRVLPFYATNTLKGEFVKKYYMWPIVSTVDYTNERNPGGGMMVFPLFGKIKTERADNYWVLPPFFRYMNSDEQRIIHAPWPFVQLADGTVKKRIYWPLYGKKEQGSRISQYALWPILWNNSSQLAGHQQRCRRIVPFFISRSDLITEDTEAHEVGDISARYWKLWPLMSWEREGDQSRFRALELWPLKNTEGIERNWAPWWSLYRRDKNRDEIGHHFLWGLFRRSHSDAGSEWSLLKGVLGYRKKKENRQCRILFKWFGEEEE